MLGPAVVAQRRPEAQSAEHDAEPCSVTTNGVIQQAVVQRSVVGAAGDVGETLRW